MNPARIVLPVLAAAFVTAVALDARVKVKVEYDKTYPFKSVRSWGWKPGEPGRVVMARSEYDNAEVARKRAEPIIFEEVAAELAKRKLQPATGEPDVMVSYFLLLSTNMSSQTVGEFLPSVLNWGLPPFPPATQALKVMNRGSFVLDLSTKETVVWRGVADAQLETDTDAKQREKILRESIRDLLKKYPSK
jgi:hypothetical protein